MGIGSGRLMFLATACSRRKRFFRPPRRLPGRAIIVGAVHDHTYRRRQGQEYQLNALHFLTDGGGTYPAGRLPNTDVKRSHRFAHQSHKPKRNARAYAYLLRLRLSMPAHVDAYTGKAASSTFIRDAL